MDKPLIGHFKNPSKKIWLLEMPHTLYVEDVKLLARENKLKIVDARFKESFSDSEVESKPPKVTRKDAPKKQKKQKKEV